MTEVFMKDKFIVMIVIAALVLTTWAPSVAADETGGKNLTIASHIAIKTMDAHQQGWTPQRMGITETLVGVDENVKLVPLLATFWEISPDKKSWIFHLRENVHFHDGALFTAPIMKMNLERSMKVGKRLKGLPIESISAQDEKTLIITTKEAFAPLGAYLAVGESAALAPSSFDDKGDLVKLVGTGPYMLKSWKIKDEVVATKNPDYWGKNKASVDTVTYKSVTEAVTRIAMVRAGEVDIAQILPPDLIKTIQSEPDLKFQVQSIGRCRMAGFNLKKEPFNDARVRLAVNYAINREDLVKYVLDGYGESASTLFPPNIHWANKDLKVFHHDPEKAKQLLAEAGWKDSDGDGVLDKDGKPLTFKIVTYPKRATLPPTAEVIQSQLGKIGVKAELAIQQYDAAYQARNDGDFGMFLVGRGLLFVPDPDYNMMVDYFSSKTIQPGWGAFHYNNPEVDSLLLKGRQESDPDGRKVIYDKIQAILLKELPMAYLSYYANVDVYNKRVKNYRIHPIEYTFGLEKVELD
jgi:peptide/nickel transport system substrate-binding protein